MLLSWTEQEYNKKQYSFHNLVQKYQNLGNNYCKKDTQDNWSKKLDEETNQSFRLTEGVEGSEGRSWLKLWGSYDGQFPNKDPMKI